MGNKFSNKTQVNLRPKVCKSPPSTPHPDGPPPIPTFCCLNAISATVRFTFHDCQCATLNGFTGLMVSPGPATPSWQADVIWPGDTITSRFLFSCNAISPGVFRWQWISVFNVKGPSPQNCDFPYVCTPLNVNFHWRLNGSGVPATCATNQRNTQITVVPA